MLKKLEGTWVVESVTKDGKPSFFPPKDSQLVFMADKMTISPTKGKERTQKYTIDPSKKPNEIDFESDGGPPPGSMPPKGIFELDGDTLKLSAEPKRPTELSDKGQSLWTLKRKK